MGHILSACFEAAGLTNMWHGQSVYHGFGKVLSIDKLLKIEKLHLRDAVMTVLEDPNYQVSLSDRRPPSFPTGPVFLVCFEAVERTALCLSP